MPRTPVEFHTEWTIADAEDDPAVEAKKADEKPPQAAGAKPAEDPGRKPAVRIAGR
jgi:hypothetical protein